MGEREIGPSDPRERPEPAVTAAPRRPARRVVRDYSVLAKVVRESGLNRRRYGYYWTRLVGTVAAFGLVWTGIVLVGDSWWQLLLAVALAVVLAQLAFLGHDSSHRQIFRSREWNDWTGRVLANVTYTEVGLFRSYGIVVRYLNDVEHRARDPFSCPLATQLGR